MSEPQPKGFTMTDLASLTTYSEWLDSQGLVVSDQGPDTDKRSHSDLAAEFLKVDQ